MTTDTIAPPTDQTPAAIPHLARCAECDFAVRFTPSTSGAGFTLVDSDRALGIGDSGRPTCPNGHGEMALADDQLPIEQAITETAARIDAAVQRDLPGIVPAFNWQGAYLELETMSVEVDRLHRIWDDDAKQAKESKGQWEEASKRRDKAALEFRRRRLAKGDDTGAPAPAANTNLVHCTWEQAHPDESCPVCDDPDGAAERGCGGTARDSAQHVDAGDRYARLLDSEALADDLKAAGLIVPLDVIRAWTEAEFEAVKEWAEVENGLADPPDGGLRRPSVLGTAHVAADGIQSEAVPGDTYQCCRECGARLVTVTTGGDQKLEPYPAGTLVGIDCPGAKEPARQIKRGKKASNADRF